MKSSVELISRLESGFNLLGLDLAPEPFLQYLALLEKWNRVYNLSGIHGLEEMVTRHILDSVSILRWVRGPRLLDVGTGAGLPGIPLALAAPELEVVLLDSNGKKTRFLQEVKRVLGLHHVEIIQNRVEAYHPPASFDTVTSRAFSELAQMIYWTQHAIKPNGLWLAMKGHRPDTELTALSFPYRVEYYTVPSMEGSRCCILIDNEMKE